ncbi:MAG: diguanylate cyclase [Rhizobiales bacterium]|nr:diguanylate cyclase [Hyphomicrobiales bacterium]
MWESLAANLAVILALLVGWTSASERVAGFSATTQKILFGLLMAVGTLGSMMMAYEFAPGRYTDLRMAIITLAGFFGGLPAALLAGTAALLYRAYLGGAFLAGASFIVLAMAIGLAGYALRRGKPVMLAHVVLLAFAVVGATLGLMKLAFPSFVTMTALWIPSFYTFSATLLLGAVLILEARRRELLTSSAYYQSMVNALPDCLNIKDLDGRFLAANPATSVLMDSASPQDLVGKTDFDFYTREIAEGFRQDEIAVLKGGENRILEQHILLPNGVSRFVSTLKAPVRDASGKIFALITWNRDITEQKRAQAKLEEMQVYLDLALENMHDGLAIYDPNGLLVFCNARYREMFPRTAHLRRPGANFADIIKAAIALGEEQFPGNESIDDYVLRKLHALREEGAEMIGLEDGKTYALRTTILANGCSLRIVSDATEQQRLQNTLSYQAFHDPLTGLANRAKFHREFMRRLDEARTEQTELTVMVLDLDRFKEVNDNFGHEAGDKLLVEVARRLESTVRQGDLVARLGGDEFAILLSGGIGRSDPAQLAERILKAVSQPLNLGDTTLLSGISIGYTTYPFDNSDLSGLLRHADQALYFAKARGRRTYQRYDSGEQIRSESA